MRSCTPLLIFVITWAWPVAAITQDQSAQRVAELEAQIGPLYTAGKFAEVYPLLEEQLRLHTAAGGRESEPAIATLVRLGDCLGKQQKFLDAAKPFAEALALQEKRPNRNEAEIWRLRNSSRSSWGAPPSSLQRSRSRAIIRSPPDRFCRRRHPARAPTSAAQL